MSIDFKDDSDKKMHLVEKILGTMIKSQLDTFIENNTLILETAGIVDQLYV